MLNSFKDLKIKSNDLMDWAVNFVTEKQLYDEDLWEKFVSVFKTHEDTDLGRWRGEYFGKQMRGAALTYAYTKDERLYKILTKTVKKLLENQDEYGRFSTYRIDNEFHGWDMWCRKYVLVGLIYYYGICKDEGLRTEIITACKRHLDYILEKVGPNEGQTEITKTSHWWGCVNSCTILEPTVEIYKLTGEARYLDFARYIISTGGCSDCNLIELALSDEIYPYQYPVTKAYEMMSFFEGLLAFYEVTGEQKYFDAVVKFFDAVAKTDVTIIGCSGCTHELFDNSSLCQTEFRENIMQETCVTVTWMRVLRRLFLLTKESKYIDWFEKSMINALYGSLNTESLMQLSMERNALCEAMAFDSYSPLYMNTRGRGIGGYNEFSSGRYYGCCLAIGACGVALAPLTAIMQDGEFVYINWLFNGSAEAVLNDGSSVRFIIDGAHPVCGKATVTVSCEKECRIKLKIRKPEWSKTARIDGKTFSESGYLVIDKTVSNGDIIEIELEPTVMIHRLNGKVAFTYGGITLATDEHKAKRDIKKPLPSCEPEFEILPKDSSELIRILCRFESGDEIILTDYQSCGKKWLSDKPLMTVWFDLE